MIEDEKRTKFNCFFYDCKHKNCTILRQLYCENEPNKCKFFKTPEEKKKDDEKYNSYYYIKKVIKNEF